MRRHRKMYIKPCAKVSEGMVAKTKPVDRTDKILRAVAELQIAQAPNVAACKFDSAAPKRRREHPGQSNTRYVENNANNTPRTTPGKWKSARPGQPK